MPIQKLTYHFATLDLYTLSMQPRLQLLNHETAGPYVSEIIGYAESQSIFSESDFTFYQIRYS